MCAQAGDSARLSKSANAYLKLAADTPAGHAYLTGKRLSKTGCRHPCGTRLSKSANAYLKLAADAPAGTPI